MRNRLNVALATVAALALGIALFAAVALASSPGHGHQPSHGTSPAWHTTGIRASWPRPQAAAPVAAADRHAAKPRTATSSPSPATPLCMLPFPDDYYTVPDPSQPDRPPRRLHRRRDAGQRRSAPTSTPRPTTPPTASAPARRSCSRCPGIDTVADVAATGAAPINHIGQLPRSANAPIVVIDADTGKRWPIWAEIDSTATDPAKAVLEIHPAVNFASGHRYIVALRDLRNAAGERDRSARPPSATTATACPPKQPEINARRGHFESDLQDAAALRHRPRRPLPRLGLHRRQRREQRRPRARACATTPSPSSATPTSPTACRRAPRRASR